MSSDANNHPAFLVTKEYRRFAEFCNACRRHRYIGLCYGPPGVGKTQSARSYSMWDEIVAAHQRLWAHEKKALPPPPTLKDCRSVFYTAPVSNSPRVIENDLSTKRWYLNDVVSGARSGRKLITDDEEDDYYYNDDETDYAELFIVDEADRLKVPSLEQLRDLYDHKGFGLVLIGMPGIEKRLSRYAQLYSRVGFVHQFRPLSTAELRFILEEKWRDLGLSLDKGDFTDAEAIAAVIRITGGNFRLLQRLFSQIARILEINKVSLVTKEVVEAARESLVIGATA